MNVEELRNYCLSKKGVTEAFPFDEDVLVFKVMNKIFVLTSLQNWEEGKGSLNLKCEPETALQLRQDFVAIKPGYHMNKKHWNTVQVDGSLPAKFLQKMIDNSYDLIVRGLPKKLQKELQEL